MQPHRYVQHHVQAMRLTCLICSLTSLFTRLNTEAEHQALREQGTGFDRLWLKPDGGLLVCDSNQAFAGAVGAVEMVAVEGDVRR